MITSIRLVNFKNFADETLRVGPFTVIVGANASGKSNIRDAFRFLHGIGRGYTLAEIIGGKYGADWKPIRGAANEIVRFGQCAFSIEVRMKLEDADARYLIEVSGDKERPNEFRFTKEKLTGVLRPGHNSDFGSFSVTSDPDRDVSIRTQSDAFPLLLNMFLAIKEGDPKVQTKFQPALEKIGEPIDIAPPSKKYLEPHIQQIITIFANMRFLELSPDRMREPGFPGATVLGDSGENLPTGLEDICADPKRKEILTSWVHELTPMDVADFEFPRDPSGRIHLMLCEANGRKMKPSWKPWHEVVQLRDDLKTGELSLAVFAADLYDVVMQKGQRPVYEHPAEFFALASFASVDTETGKHQEWRPILEGELAKARTIQSEATGLRHREMEQAVISVFLSSQPIGHKAWIQELMVLLGAAKPDKIELEKALRRWTELSWFLDEVEVGAGETNADGTRQLPRAWRLGNRPNLRQMHHDACSTRVPPTLVESQIINAIEKLKTLTSGASAAGARVHNLPERPRDIADDGEFHYAILGPQAASESGKPSTVAKRFIDETTAPDRPRVYRNAVVLSVSSRDGLDAARTRVREYLGWEEVGDQLKDQPIDPIREQMLATETETARRRIPEAIRQAYSVVVTVSESNAIHAFKVVVTDEPLFTTIKADRRSRVQKTAISSEAMMPGGPYDLWRKDEPSRRVKDLVGAFAQFPKLPKMLRRKEILDTVVQGVQEGIWVAQVVRPDRTVRTFWRTAIDEAALKDSGLEVLLPDGSSSATTAPPGPATSPVPST